MVVAFVLCVTEAGTERDVVERLESFDEVDEAFVVYGEYDVIAKVNVQEIKMLDKFITENMRSIKEIQMTSTMISV
ncbi:MAG: Lrp/AsnC ligand binding domain-containing protein [Candidatus Methanofastidiosia archaeon]